MHRRGPASRARPGRLRRPVVVATGVLLLCTACTTVAAGPRRGDLGSQRSAPTTSTTTTTTEPPLPVAPVQWTPCGDLQCGSVTVPLDYRRPDAGSIQIAVARHPAEIPSQRIGSIVINPGGPGGSGIDDLPNELSVLTPGLLDRFDIVSFDPRGVQRSSPVTCSTGQSSGPAGELIDPELSAIAYATQQAESFESELDSFFSWCAGDESCPWRPAGDPTAALLALIQSSAVRPLASGNGTAGPGELYDALLAGLGSQNSWPTLAAALADAAAGNGSEATSMTDRYETGGSTNGADAEQAIDCLDHPVDRQLSAYPALATASGSVAPVFGPLLTWGLLGCATWPASPTRTPAPASDPGAPPILVVGTSGDPVTPYAWAVALAHELTGGALLTWQGQSHVAYFYSACVRAAVESYLIGGTLPAPGATCTD